MPKLRPDRLAIIVAFAAGLGVLAWASMLLMRRTDSEAAFWPVDALVAAFLVRWAKGRFEAAAIFVSSGAVLLAASMTGGSNHWLGSAYVAINLAEIAAAAWLLRKAGPPVESPAAFGAFVAGPVLILPALAAGCAALAATAGTPGSNPHTVFLHWFFALALGMAIVGSLALTVGRESGRRTTRAGWIRFALSQAGVMAGCLFVLLILPVPPLFLLAPFLVMGTLSHRELGGVASVAVTACVVVAATLLGAGPAGVARAIHVDRVLLTQTLLAALVFTVLPVSALLRRLEAYEMELEERRARAEELNGLKSRLLAYVGHEIRSPLSGVTSLAGLMRDGVMGELTSEQHETLTQIASTGAEVEALARDLTDAAAIEAGRATVELAPTPVGEAIRAAVNLARFRTAHHRAEVLAPPGSADDLMVTADPLRLRQILVNLLVNGAKYGGRPPQVTISARLTEAGAIRFEVADNGAGIPLDRHDSLFEAFERLGAERTGIEGVGLGLALSQEMARLQNGRLGIDETTGGARFWLELPVWVAQAAAA